MSKTTKKTQRVALYARVSTDGQTTENQLRQLRLIADAHGWTVVKEYVDHGISGAKGRDQRPQFDAMWKGVTRREFDRVAVWSVDRIGRRLLDVEAFLSDCEAKRVDLYLHQQVIDTATPTGRAMFQMCGVFAQLERATIQARVRAGLDRALEKGKVLGRRRQRDTTKGNQDPAKYAAKVRETDAEVLSMLAAGVGKKKIARTLGIGVSVVQRLAGTTAAPAQ